MLVINLNEISDFLRSGNAMNIENKSNPRILNEFFFQLLNGMIVIIEGDKHYYFYKLI